MVDQRLVDVLDPSGIRAPCVHGKTVFLGEEVFEERDVLGFLRDVHHALVTNVFVQPDRPTQAILRTFDIRVSDVTGDRARKD